MLRGKQKAEPLRVVTVWIANAGPGLGSFGRFRRFESQSPVSGVVVGIRAWGYDTSTRVLRLWLGDRLLLSTPENPALINDQRFAVCDRRFVNVEAGERIRCDVQGRPPEQLAVRVQWVQPRKGAA